MNQHTERARQQQILPEEKIRECFPGIEKEGALDAAWLGADRKSALGVSGLPWPAPVCMHLMADPEVSAFLAGRGSVLLHAGEEISAESEEGKCGLPEEVRERASRILKAVLDSPGQFGPDGEHVIDLKTYPVGLHFNVNLLMGDRRKFAYPLVTTPKSVLDGFGRGSFRGAGREQVLATRYVLAAEENGEPANRQFYLSENGRQIFYSANAQENVADARCTHLQNRSEIFYRTEDGLEITRQIFLLPQEEGMPNAVEAQRIRIRNTGEKERKLKLTATGVFGIADASKVTGDIVYANLVQESEVFYIDGKPLALSMFAKPDEDKGKKRFAMLLSDGKTMEDFCTSQADFIGNGSLEKPEFVSGMPSVMNRKMAPFFAMGMTLTVRPGGETVADELVGIVNEEEGICCDYESALLNLYQKYRDPGALAAALSEVETFQEAYRSYLVPETGDEKFNAYAGKDLPFQVLYQTYVSRAFAWTQKSYRETGFREIQDIYASMYYMNAMGEQGLIKELIGNWIRNVFRMGYANHNFTVEGKEPGMCSDDALWLVQAVYRYVKLTGDTAFLSEEYPVAGESEKRPLWDTLMAILAYSGRISVGKNALPLLDRADWNDTLQLDGVFYDGPEKEKAYREQLEKTGASWGDPWDNTLCESTMNACLLKIAADEAAELAALTGREADGQEAAGISRNVKENMQAHAWKDGFFARCLINDGREGGYTYLGAPGDGLSLDESLPGTFYLNSYSWTLLAGIATKEQTRTMLDAVNKYLRTDAGLKLCTLVDYDRLGVKTGTALYFPGDRENCGVFKHAAMMATVASLKAAKETEDEALAKDLAELAFFMLDRTLPYLTFDAPFTYKGNPRFCTQYNNSETGENIGPMLSGTASWLTLALYEIFGICETGDALAFRPLLRPGETQTGFSMKLGNARIRVRIKTDGKKFRADGNTGVTLDGAPVGESFPKPESGEHEVVISL